MKTLLSLAFFMLASLPVRFAAAQAPAVPTAGEAPPAEAPESEQAEETEAPAEKTPAKAPEAPRGHTQPPEPPKEKTLLDRFAVNFYGVLMPFVEHITTGGATPPGFTGGASGVAATDYTGFNDRPRMRMTAGTSNIGFRGTVDVFPQLKLTWQVESAVPIDGNGPPDTIASRNSHIGFSGDWGTLIFGKWDTPWKWATLVTINPIQGSYVPDYTSILSTPGFGVAAVNLTSVLQGSISNAAFYRREPNSIQYWSPNIAGFSLRLNYTINEARPSPGDIIGLVPNPYLISGYLGFDGFGLRVRYAYEMHHDYFGMSQLGGTRQGAPEVTAALDQGHQATVQYTLTVTPKIRTRLVATGEYLSYTVEDSTPDAITEYARPAFYALLEQTLHRHHVWVAYGQDFEGECRRASGGPCTTTGLGAKLGTLGYMFDLDDNLNVHLVGYQLFNDVSSRHSTFPPLETESPGLDITGIGLGVFYAFDVGLHP